jgi:hypothetical protein
MKCSNIYEKREQRRTYHHNEKQKSVQQKQKKQKSREGKMKKKERIFVEWESKTVMEATDSRNQMETDTHR